MGLLQAIIVAVGLLIGGTGFSNQLKNESSNSDKELNKGVMYNAYAAPHQNGHGNDFVDSVNFTGVN